MEYTRGFLHFLSLQSKWNTQVQKRCKVNTYYVRSRKQKITQYECVLYTKIARYIAKTLQPIYIDKLCELHGSPHVPYFSRHSGAYSPYDLHELSGQ